MHFARRPVTRFLRVIDTGFGDRALAWDALFALLALGWFALQLFKPELFDRPGWVGITWLPDFGWEIASGAIVAAHARALFSDPGRRWRIGALMVSAWLWLFVAISLARIEITVGGLCFGLLGLFAIGVSIYVVGLPPRRG